MGRSIPISADEYTDWVALYNLEAKEHKAAEKAATAKARKGRRR